MSEVEETLKRINSHKGVQGIVIVNQDMVPIRSTLDDKMSKALATDITQLCGRARSAVRSLDPQNDLTFLRIRSKKYEILVAPDKVRARACPLFCSAAMMCLLPAAAQPLQLLHDGSRRLAAAASASCDSAAGSAYGRPMAATARSARIAGPHMRRAHMRWLDTINSCQQPPPHAHRHRCMLSRSQDFTLVVVQNPNAEA